MIQRSGFSELTCPDGAGVMQGTPFLVTEYMPIGSLRALLKSSEFLSWQQRLQFAVDAGSDVFFFTPLDVCRSFWHGVSAHAGSAASAS